MADQRGAMPYPPTPGTQKLLTRCALQYSGAVSVPLGGDRGYATAHPPGLAPGGSPLVPPSPSAGGGSGALSGGSAGAGAAPLVASQRG